MSCYPCLPPSLPTSLPQHPLPGTYDQMEETLRWKHIKAFLAAVGGKEGEGGGEEGGGGEGGGGGEAMARVEL